MVEINCCKERCGVNCISAKECHLLVKSKEKGLPIWISRHKGVRNFWIFNPELMGEKAEVRDTSEEEGLAEPIKPSMVTFEDYKKRGRGRPKKSEAVDNG